MAAVHWYQIFNKIHELFSQIKCVDGLRNRYNMPVPSYLYCVEGGGKADRSFYSAEKIAKLQCMT